MIDRVMVLEVSWHRQITLNRNHGHLQMHMMTSQLYLVRVTEWMTISEPVP